MMFSNLKIDSLLEFISRIRFLEYDIASQSERTYVIVSFYTVPNWQSKIAALLVLSVQKFTSV